MEKEILVSLSRGTPDDGVTYMENGVEKTRDGLCKVIESDFCNRTFRDLVAYMCDPHGDERNEPYSSSERDFAEHIIELVTKEDVYVTPFIQNDYDSQTRMSLDKVINEFCPRILNKKSHSIDGMVQTVNYIGLRLGYDIRGGQNLD